MIAVLATAGACLTGATPLTMSYSVTPLGGGTYSYVFSLTLDNNDSSWVAGQDFNWIIFGDQQSSPTNLTNFVGDPASLPVGPFTSYNSSSGVHNGPTFISLPNPGWVPGFIGDSLSWDGASTANLGAGQLLWSNIAGNGAPATFAAATLSTPEPSTLGLLGAGLLALGYLRGRRRASSRRAQ